MPKKIALDVSPLGVHIHDTGIAVVLLENRAGSPYFRSAREVDLGNDTDKTTQEKQISALQQAREEIAPAAKTCIIALPADKVIIERYVPAPKEKERHTISAAKLRADELQRLADEDRIVAIDRLPGSEERMISIAKIADVQAMIDICEAAGLQVVGIDTPLAAWQRTLYDKPDGALLDLSSTKRPALYIFANPLGTVELLPPGSTAEKTAAAVRQMFLAARMEHFSDVRHLSVTGTFGDVSDKEPYGDKMSILLNGLRTDKGLEVNFVTFGTNENPGWAFAAALGGWPFGGSDVVRANLLPPKKTGKVFLGIRMQPGDLIRAAVTAASVALLLAGLQFSVNTQINAKQAELNSINDQLASMAYQTNAVGTLSADVHRLQEIARDSLWLRSSGQIAALRLGYLGNAVPQGAWIEHISHGRDGWTIEGGAKDLKTLAAVARGFQNVSPGLQTSFTTIDTQKGPGYKVTISEPALTTPVPSSAQFSTPTTPPTTPLTSTTPTSTPTNTPTPGPLPPK